MVKLRDGVRGLAVTGLSCLTCCSNRCNGLDINEVCQGGQALQYIYFILHMSKCTLSSDHDV